MTHHRYWILACLTCGAACGAQVEPSPPAECAAAWAAVPAQELVQALVSATASDRAIWGAYNLGVGSYVLNAGPSDAGGACLGVVHDGHAVAYAHVPDEPKLLTPLYGYYFAADWHGAPQSEMLDHARQPASIRAWLEGAGIRSAVVLPVVVRNFPMELPTVMKAQLGIHEAFHVEVQAPRWYASTGAWPAWDRQPDRPGVPACYAASSEVEAELTAERAQLVQLVSSLLDADSTTACSAGASFLAHRTARYDLLRDVHVARYDSTAGSCREAEAIMELEEGTADYASWVPLFNLGQASRDLLLRRYRAVQQDVFYMTGNMQLHAIRLMYPDSMAAVAARIAQSSGPDEGGITPVLQRALQSYCR